MSSTELHDIGCLASFGLFMRGDVSSADGDGPTFNWTAGSIFPWLVAPEDSSDVLVVSCFDCTDLVLPGAPNEGQFGVHDPIQPKFSESVACVVSKSS